MSKELTAGYDMCLHKKRKELPFKRNKLYCNLKPGILSLSALLQKIYIYKKILKAYYYIGRQVNYSCYAI